MWDGFLLIIRHKTQRKEEEEHGKRLEIPILLPKKRIDFSLLGPTKKKRRQKERERAISHQSRKARRICRSITRYTYQLDLRIVSFISPLEKIMISAYF